MIRAHDNRCLTPHLLLEAVCQPQDVGHWSLSQWDHLIPAAKATGLLSWLAIQCESAGLYDRLPDEVLRHLISAQRVVEHRQRAVRWELTLLARALAEVDTQLIVLKGAAYVMAGLEAGVGRLTRDIDILVPESKLSEVESSLLQRGWVNAEDDPRHELYFRRWLHELPPLVHVDRKVPVDIHHTIVPRTDSLRVAAQDLIDAAQPLPNSSWSILQPADLVLHAATHLFRNGDFRNGLRDLCDIDRLLRQYDTADGDAFWQQLVSRAEQLDLRLPCFCGLHFCRQLLDTPIPHETWRTIQRWKPTWPLFGLVQRLVTRAALPRRLDGKDGGRELAVTALSYWPLPRFRAMASTLFWTKRLPQRRRDPATPDLEP